jgi:hypothetical protein
MGCLERWAENVEGGKQVGQKAVKEIESNLESLKKLKGQVHMAMVKKLQSEQLTEIEIGLLQLGEKWEAIEQQQIANGFLI